MPMVAGMEKPIQREIRGMMKLMLFICCWPCWAVGFMAVLTFICR